MKPSFNRYKNKFNKTKNHKNDTQNVPVSDFVDEQNNSENSQIISGYFLNEKSYKEMIVQRVNNFLYGVLIF